MAKTFDPYRNVVFQECNMGPSGSSIPDLLVFAKSYVRTNVRIYEVKASRSDLLGDVRKGKWERYREHADKIYFALGPNIEWKDVLTQQPVGVMVRGPEAWKIVKNAPVNNERKPITEDVFLALVFSHLPSVRDRQNEIDRLIEKQKLLMEGDLKKLEYRLDGELGKKVEELNNWQSRLERIQEEALGKAYEQIANELGLGYLSLWKEEQYAKDFLKKLFEDEVRAAVNQAVTKSFERLMQVKNKSEEKKS